MFPLSIWPLALLMQISLALPLPLLPVLLPLAVRDCCRCLVLLLQWVTNEQKSNVTLSKKIIHVINNHSDDKLSKTQC